MRCRLSFDEDRLYGGLMLLQHREGLSSVSTIDGSKTSLLDTRLGQALLGVVRRHICFGAATLGEAIKRGGETPPAGAQRLYFAVYPDMETVTSAAMLLTDLEAYFDHAQDCDPAVTTFVPIFPNYEPASQAEFAEAYWRFMQRISDLSLLATPWPAGATTDPEDPRFRLFVAGEAIFTTTLHFHAGRAARKSAYPMWVVNRERQFDALRADGRLPGWRQGIQHADARIDPSGLPNPLLADRDASSAARQIAGSVIEPCPFQVRSPREAQEIGERLLAMASQEMAPREVEALIARRLIRPGERRRSAQD